MLLAADGMAVLLGLNGPIHIIPTVFYRPMKANIAPYLTIPLGGGYMQTKALSLSALCDGSLVRESSSRPWSYSYEYLEPEPGEARAKGQQRMSG